MSGPIQPSDSFGDEETLVEVELREGRSASVGAARVVRVLPTKGRRTVGPWCFADLIVPPDFEDPRPLEIGPHPHIGLATVTWLFEGEVLHGDSLGTEQLIRPGQLNLMTAGHGIAHSEEGKTANVSGVQLWLAQPDDRRDGDSRFQHIESLPSLDLDNATARILVGDLGGESSPARIDHPAIGAELALRGGPCSVPVDTAFEIAIVPTDQRVSIGEIVVDPGWVALVPPGTAWIPLDSDGPTTVMLLGGSPLGTKIQMWWNFVARTLDEIEQAWRDWEAGNIDRFGHVPTGLQRVTAPRPHWL